MKKNILLMSIMLLYSVLTFAFDGRKSGFILGGGLMLGSNMYQQEYTSSYNYYSYYNNYSYSIDENAICLNTDFKIGYGFNEQFLLFYSNKVSFFSDDYLDSTVITGFTGLGMSYYLQSQSPCIYITGGIGASSWIDDWDSSVGFGMYGGVGYEFSKHWSVEFNIIYGASEFSDGTENNSTCFTLGLTGLAY